MPLTYQDVITADLSPIVDVAKAWEDMGERFGELKGDYSKRVPRALANGNWQGEAFEAHQRNTSAASLFEFSAAKTEALAIGSLLRKGHAELVRLRKVVKNLVDDAEEKHYKVDSSGKVTYVGADQHEKQALRNDPTYAAAQQEAEQDWTRKIAKAVQAVDKADQKIKRALIRAVEDLSLDGRGIGGFNAHPETDLDKAGMPEETCTRTDGWVSKGKHTVTGPDIGFSATGPGYGREGMLKGYVDFVHATSEGSLTREETKLSHIADGYAGVRGTVSGGITDQGLDAKGEVSGGGRGLAEGRVESDVAGTYGRLHGFAGGEAALKGGAGFDGVSASREAFAGVKGGGAAGVEAGGISIGATGEAWAGAGAEADFEWERNENGKLRIYAKGGAAIPFGGAAGMEITIDPGRVADTAADAADAVGDTVGSLKNTVTSLF
ncbi:hypothetical protein [Streptomyces spirodelae]|uniref:WXG100 family type VII secretion target n=1 Tax=Streptomyces spirodelae TaxID=2812904 RepID=A0ABS3X1H5_9ACTN|nr:hypothetical protein [Streptomyces spirodelae]MBO8189236.1 hypothetical protein [Streptomyces spirodelae]